MSEYIEREAAKKKHCDICRESNICYRSNSCADLKCFDTIPAADVRPVVRCKDCKHSYDSIGGTFCSYGVCVDCVVDIDFYCANGERK